MANFERQVSFMFILRALLVVQWSIESCGWPIGDSRSLRMNRSRATQLQVLPGRRDYLTLSLAAVLTRPLSTLAFCGGDVPFWAHFIPYDEGVVPIGKGELFVRLLGDEKKELSNKGGQFPFTIRPSPFSPTFWICAS